MKKEGMQKLILAINFISLAIIAVGIIMMKYAKIILLVTLVIGILGLVFSVSLAQKWKKIPAQEQQPF